jgi:DNA polymerase-3 subunit gamma/tau
VSYEVFARKYRPQTFDEVVGQEHITQTLKNAIEQQRLAHAYLFVGPRGTGKTSTARILAKALNCVNGPTVTPCGVCDMCREIAAGTSFNVLEFDAASNTQVDKVRELIIDNVKYAPAKGRYKMYIIDEVHMLSNSSFNALLKTLEEPPKHVIFIFATTEVNKLPLTIISRCQRFDLRRIPAVLIAKHLQFIAKKEKIALDEQAAQTIARGAEGGLRDAESMLDQLVAFCGDKIGEHDVLSVFGFTAQETVAKLCGAIIGGDSRGALGIVHEQAEAGKDLSQLMSDLIEHMRDLLVSKADAEAIVAELGAEAAAMLQAQADQISMEQLLELIDQFAVAEGRMKWAPNKKLHFEVATIKAIQTLGQATLTQVIDTLAALREGKEPPAVGRTSNIEHRTPNIERPARAAAIPARAAAPAPRIEETPKPSAFASDSKSETEPSSLILHPSSFEDLWPALLGEIRKRRPLILSWLASGTLLEVRGDACIVGFPKDQSLAKESVERAANRKIVEEVLTQLAGRPLTLQCELRDGLAAGAMPEIPETKPEPPADPMAEFKNDPLIRKALEIFKGEIQSA